MYITLLDNVLNELENLLFSGSFLEAKYPHMFWTPCAAHCISLMLKDIGKLPVVKMTLTKAMEVTGYIYSHGWVLSLMRQKTGKRELLRPAVTRFATSYLTLSSLHAQKFKLRNMFISAEWKESRWAKEQKGRAVEKIVGMNSFWNNVSYVLKLTAPLVRVLRLVDSEKKPAMGYIYEGMDRAKEAIMAAFDDESRYKAAFEIIDRRWEVQLHRPLHAAGYFFNPEYFYDRPDISSDEEIMSGLYKVIEKMVSLEDQDKIDRQISVYKNAGGLFGYDIAVRNRKKKSPGKKYI